MKKLKDFPILSALMLVVIVMGCGLAVVFGSENYSYMNTDKVSLAPCKEALFGTDMMGRDLFACIWHGGFLSLEIGFLATLIATAIAVIWGCAGGFFSDFWDKVLMRLCDIMLSIPGLLLVIFLQALFGEASVLSLSLVLGLCGWFSMAKVIRTEVKKLKKSEYVIASRCMGGSFRHIMYRHFLPGILPAIMFMVVMQVRTAIVTEATLSFMGLGLPIQKISLGSLLSQAQRAMNTKAWWVFFFPGIFLIALILSLTNLGNYIRKRNLGK